MQLVLSMLMGMLMKLATQEVLEYVIVLSAEKLAKMTDTDYDDKLVEKVKATLNK